MGDACPCSSFLHPMGFHCWLGMIVDQCPPGMCTLDKDQSANNIKCMLAQMWPETSSDRLPVAEATQTMPKQQMSVSGLEAPIDHVPRWFGVTQLAERAANRTWCYHCLNAAASGVCPLVPCSNAAAVAGGRTDSVFSFL